MVKGFVTETANVILVQDHVFVVLVLKELNVKVSLIENMFWFDLSCI